MVEWFGYWPSLHDATIEEIHLMGEGESRIVISTCQYLSETDSQGYFKTTKHCRITLVFARASDISLTSDSGPGSIILNHDWADEDNQMTFGWDSAVGFAGSIRAQTWRIEFEPTAA